MVDWSSCDATRWQSRSRKRRTGPVPGVIDVSCLQFGNVGRQCRSEHRDQPGHVGRNPLGGIRAALQLHPVDTDHPRRWPIRNGGAGHRRAGWCGVVGAVPGCWHAGQIWSRSWGWPGSAIRSNGSGFGTNIAPQRAATVPSGRSSPRWVSWSLLDRRYQLTARDPAAATTMTPSSASSRA